MRRSIRLPAQPPVWPFHQIVQMPPAGSDFKLAGKATIRAPALGYGEGVGSRRII